MNGAYGARGGPRPTFENVGTDEEQAGSAENPIILSRDQMQALLSQQDVHPKSNLWRNALSGHVTIQAADNRVYSVATSGDDGLDRHTRPDDVSPEEAFGRSLLDFAAASQPARIPSASRDPIDLVAEAMFGRNSK